MDRDFIAIVPKNKQDEIRLEFNEFNGHQLIDVRIWTPNSHGQFVRTKAGVSVRVVLIHDLIEALQEAERQAIAAGLL